MFFYAIESRCQSPTIGLIQNDAGSLNGYTLFSPNSNNTTYLIDNCGNKINSWQSNFPPGLSGYLLPDGHLLRTARINNPIFSGTGGAGGAIELFNWTGNLIWSYNYSDSIHYQHHDIEYLPNGNILILAWERKSAGEALNNGRDPSFLGSSLWSEHIVEIEPSGTNGATIVWEWHVWDHLVQTFDSSKLNFGIISNHPELINLNFTNSSNTDWLHINSINYNATLDQILLSAHNNNEIWIIDHSTTTSEAATHSGGNAGKGGDLLYRWGNPRAYQRGNVSNQKLWGQHDAHWIEPNLSDAGKIMIFNNGINRSGGNYSSVDVISTALDSTGNYVLNGTSAYGPDSLSWQYASSPPSAFYSSNISGAQRLSNGNTLICDGSAGNFFEIDSTKNLVWRYINPVSQAGPLSQGSMPIGNAVFRCTRFGPDFPGFTGVNLMPGLPIELNPYTSTCSIFTGIENKQVTGLNSEFNIYPNPVLSNLFVRFSKAEAVTITIKDTQGRSYTKIHSDKNELFIPVSGFPAGVYFITLEGQNYNTITRFIKL